MVMSVTGSKPERLAESISCPHFFESESAMPAAPSTLLIDRSTVDVETERAAAATRSIRLHAIVAGEG
jgi:hypothetical protein